MQYKVRITTPERTYEWNYSNKFEAQMVYVRQVVQWSDCAGFYDVNVELIEGDYVMASAKTNSLN